jgi:hypothetical protein
MTTTSTRTTAPAPPRSPVILRRLLPAGAAAAISGIAIAEAYAALIRTTGVPMKAGFLGASHASPVTAASFATGVLVCVFWGTIVAAVVARASKRPARTFIVLGCCLTALSLAVPIGAGATAVSTKATLAVAHVLVASVVLPILARALRPKL